MGTGHHLIKFDLLPLVLNLIPLRNLLDLDLETFLAHGQFIFDQLIEIDLG